MNKEQFIEKLIERLDDQFYEEVSIKYIKSLIEELSEEREEVFEFINNCNISKEDWLVYLERETHNEVIENMIKSYINISNRFKQPTPLKVAIKGDCTYDYSKKIFQYFKSHTIKGQHDVDSFLEDVYYYIEKGNIVFSPFLPEGYTEISLKEEWKEIDSEVLEVLNSFSKASGIKHSTKNKGISYTDSVLNAYIIALEHKSKRVEELEKELIDLKLKLKDLSK